MPSSSFSAIRAGALAMLFSVVAGLALSASAQTTLDVSTPHELTLQTPSLRPMPKQITTQQRQAAQKLTPTQLEQYRTIIQPTLAKLRDKISAQQQSAIVPNWKDVIRNGIDVSRMTAQADAPSAQSTRSVTSSTFNFTNRSGTPFTAQATVSEIHGKPALDSAGQVASFGASPLFPRPCPPLHPDCNDKDHDGLPDGVANDFEGQVASNFTPLYGISAGEQQQFATFGNYVPMTVTSLVGTVPPYSYFRVQPLGLTVDANNNQVFALRIDYLSWNADGGLAGGGPTCLYSYVGLDAVVGEVSSHDLDVERSGMLVAAPAISGGYNPDPNAYSLYAVYMAAHEGTFFDQSAYAYFNPVVPAGYHLNLAQSLSKHSTYNFKPDYYPITPVWFIAAYNDSLTQLWLDGEIDDSYYYLSIAIGNDVFYGCLVERFIDQGGSYASQRINVGEPSLPINGSRFIQDDSSRALHLTDKLPTPLF